MNFLVKPAIADCPDIRTFFRDWKVGREDLIVTNEYVLAPALGGEEPPCDTLFQERYGSGEPSDEMVDAMLAAMEGKEYRRIVAIGGGSVVDIAKLFVFGGGLTCEQIYEKGAELPRKRELIIVPTTCGTGSEVTGISIVEFQEKGTKLGLSLPALYADQAVLIPSLLDTLPYDVFAASSIDALIHAVESYVSPKASSFTRALGRSAIELILGGYQKVAERGEKKLPGDLSGFLHASTMAGIAFGNAGCGAVHALSYPIGAGWHIPHGMANYMMFARVFEQYRALGTDLSPLEAVLAGALGCGDGQVWEKLFGLLDGILYCKPLRELEVDEAKCAEMARSVVRNQQRLLSNNPVPLTEEQIKEIYVRCI